SFAQAHTTHKRTVWRECWTAQYVRRLARRDSPLTRYQSRINCAVFSRRSIPTEVSLHPVSLKRAPHRRIGVCGSTALDRTHERLGVWREEVEISGRAVGKRLRCGIAD